MRCDRRHKVPTAVGKWEAEWFSGDFGEADVRGSATRKIDALQASVPQRKNVVLRAEIRPG